MNKEKREVEPRDKDTHCYPSLACTFNISYDRCACVEAPNPGHSRCVGSRLCEEWREAN